VKNFYGSHLTYLCNKILEFLKSFKFISNSCCFQEHGIDVLTGTEVIGLNPEAKVVKLSSGKELKYDSVFLGAGSE